VKNVEKWGVAQNVKSLFFNSLQGWENFRNGLGLLGVQEAVSSNLAVPTFKINNLRAPKRCPFCFGATFGATFDF
jgi:hypothetical protein